MKLMEMVEESLRDHPETRECDKVLTLHIWRTYYSQHILQCEDGKDMMYIDSIFDLPSQDGIKRDRCIFQNDRGMYLPSEETQKKRGQLDKKWKQDHGYTIFKL